jgi:hypothetical protein
LRSSPPNSAPVVEIFWRRDGGKDAQKEQKGAFLFGVDPLDPVTFVSVPVVILLTAIVAAAARAWRASRINPAEAFRDDG